MAKKKGASKKIPLNVVKKYGSFAYCDSCGKEQLVKRAVVVSLKTRKAWMCQSCGTILPQEAKAKSKEY